MKNSIVLTAVAASVLCAPAFSQVSPDTYATQSLKLDSGLIANNDVVHRLVWKQTVRVPNATWLRLLYSKKSYLDRDSFVRIVSRDDGDQQLFEQWSLAAYDGYSASFNGGAVDVELWAAPLSSRNRLDLTGVEAGNPTSGVGVQSQCGPRDDRQLSQDKRAARQHPTGCTTWLISKFAGCTAGHCTRSSAQAMHFNVPLSSSGGTKRLPPVADHYNYDRSSLRRLNSGVGRDWATFAVVRNSNTGMYPGEKQGAWYQLGTPPRSGSIRITGYGVDRDNRNRNQVQQTHLGPLSFLSGTRLCYVTDTEGGNSGSPVIDERTGFAVGIHTHGGCRTSGSGCNSGTAINRSDLQSAIRAVLASRVAGSFENVGMGCAGSNSQVTTLRGSGIPEIGRSFSVTAFGMPTRAIGVQILGFSKTRFGTINLPLSLNGAGAPGCSLHTDVIATSGFAANASGQWTQTARIPANRALIGAKYYNQVVSVDRPANALGATTSNGLGIEIGGVR